MNENQTDASQTVSKVVRHSYSTQLRGLSRYPIETVMKNNAWSNLAIEGPTVLFLHERGV